MADTAQKIQQMITENFTVTHMELRDDSHLHAGHVEAKAHGGGHYTLILVSDDFANKARLQRQRAVNATLKQLFESNAIHALRVKLYTPEEYQ